MDSHSATDMGSRFFEGLTPADVVSLANAVIGFLAVIVAFDDPELAARLILLAAVADGVDGVLARHFGSSEIGGYLDSLADVSSFSLAPAVLVFAYASELRFPGVQEPAHTIVVVAIPASYLTFAVLRLGVYSAHDTHDTATIGAPTTLAASILAAAMLTAHATPQVMVIGCAILASLMVSPITYPDLLARDAILMGGIHVFAVLIPTFFGRVFPYALLTLALAYLIFAPRFYWGETERAMRGPPSPKGKRS